MVAQQNRSVQDVAARAVDFLNMVVSHRIGEAYRKHMAGNFRHHNPYFPGDAASLRTGMEQSHAKNPDMTLEVQRVLRDGDLVAVHSRVVKHPGDPEISVVHIFRFEGEQIAELWDIAQELPKSSSNEHGAF